MKRVQLSAPDDAPGPYKDCLSVAVCAFSMLSHLPMCSHLLFANANSTFKSGPKVVKLFVSGSGATGFKLVSFCLVFKT